MRSLQTTVLLVAALTALVTSQDATPQRWVWGRRQQAATINRDNRATTFPRQQFFPPQRRVARIIDDGVPRAQPATTFKSITARTFPEVKPTVNLLPLNHEKFTRPGKPTLTPSPIDTTPPRLASHFGVIGARKQKPTFKIAAPKSLRPKPAVITPGEFPYPFNAKPIDLGDGTSIGGRIPDDTLHIDGSKPASNSHTKGPYKPPKKAENPDTRYTTLDKLFNSRLPTQLPDPHTLSNDMLGGLHPDEVFYADKDLVIIKGGGFHSKDSHKGEDVSDLEEAAQNAVKPGPVGNELGEANDPRITNVRPDEKFSRVPLPFRFVNGNIPTIVRPHSNSQRGSNLPQHFRPVHQTAFRPMTRPSPRFPHLSVSSSQHSLAYQQPPNSFQRDEIMIAEPSVVSASKVLPPHTKRSADPSVIGYHYQTRGSGSNMHSIVDYKIHKQSSSSSSHSQQQSRTVVHQQSHNIIPSGPQKPEQVRPSPPAAFNIQNTNAQVNGENFSVPDGSAVVNLVPSVQVPRARPTPNGASTRGTEIKPTATPVSLEGDTRVNFLPPVPPVNRQAEPVGHQASQRNPLRFPTTNPQGRPNTLTHIQTAPLIRRVTQRPVSLAGDTRVNFLAPLPAVNREAEVLSSKPARRRPATVRPVNTNPQVTRLRPQGSRNNQATHFRPQTARQGPVKGGAARKRFMEPRRRQPLRQRQTPNL